MCRATNVLDFKTTWNLFSGCCFPGTKLQNLPPHMLLMIYECPGGRQIYLAATMANTYVCGQFGFL